MECHIPRNPYTRKRLQVKKKKLIWGRSSITTVLLYCLISNIKIWNQSKVYFNTKVKFTDQNKDAVDTGKIFPSIAKHRTKLQAVFRGIFGIICGISKLFIYLLIHPTISNEARNRTLARKHWAKTLDIFAARGPGLNPRAIDGGGGGASGGKVAHRRTFPLQTVNTRKLRAVIAGSQNQPIFGYSTKRHPPHPCYNGPSHLKLLNLRKWSPAALPCLNYSMHNSNTTPFIIRNNSVCTKIRYMFRRIRRSLPLYIFPIASPHSRLIRRNM
jgi:hypothetical protein